MRAAREGDLEFDQLLDNDELTVKGIEDCLSKLREAARKKGCHFEDVNNARIYIDRRNDLSGNPLQFSAVVRQGD